MVYIINQAFFSVKDKFAVTDENNNVLFTVTSPTFALTSRFQFFDKNNKEVAFAKRTMNKYVPSFIWYPNKQHSKASDTIGVLEEDVKLTKHEYDIFLPEDVQWRVNGDFLAWNFTIENDKGVIAKIEKNGINVKDVYRADVTNDADALSVIIAVVLIDNATHSSRPFRLFQ